jgi:hypothetical protein
MLVAALTFAVVMAAGAWLADARLGAGLVGRGVARVSIHPGATFIAGLAWAGTGCLAGWELARRREQTERIAS